MNGNQIFEMKPVYQGEELLLHTVLKRELLLGFHVEYDPDVFEAVGDEQDLLEKAEERDDDLMSVNFIFKAKEPTEGQYITMFNGDDHTVVRFFKVRVLPNEG